MTGDLARGRPFSDLAYIRGHADRRAAARFERLASWLGAAPPVPAATAFACADPMVRSLVTLLGEQLERDTRLDGAARTNAQNAVRSADAYARTGSSPDLPALADVVRYGAAGGAPAAIPLWRAQVGAGELVRRFDAILARRVKAPQSLDDFRPEQVNALGSALRLLGATIPDVAASVLPHVRLLCRLATPGDAADFIPSGSFRDLPGVVFLADPLLASPLDTAEAILHEACHQRYGELSHAASVLAEGYDEACGAKILTPWHRPSAKASLWGIDKALTAAHVYLYLSYFHGTLADVSADRDPAAAAAARRRFFSHLSRLRYLLAALDGNGRAQLGYAGNLLLEWMLAAAAAFTVDESGEARLTRLLLERALEENDAFRRHARAIARCDRGAERARCDAAAAWLAEREPVAAQRFARIFTEPADAAGDAPAEWPPELGLPPNAPLAHVCADRQRQASAVRMLLGLAPAELAARTDHRAALAFVQAESAALDTLLDPAFGDHLAD